MQFLCGCHYFSLDAYDLGGRNQRYLPRVSLSSHTTILSTTSKTVLTQSFINDSKNAIPECEYDFPLYDGVSVVGFICQVGSRVIQGLVKEKAEAKQVYNEAVSRRETAGLLAQGPTGDVFSTKLGNIPAGGTISTTVTYIGELKHDVSTESIRFTIPTNIAPRYGNHATSANNDWDTVMAGGDAISITVDINMAEGSFIREVRSPSHPIAMKLGNTSENSSSEGPKGSRASASLSQGSAELDRDFVLEIVNTASTTPKAVLETHSRNIRDRALMVTLVPSLELAAAKPELIIVADRSGSMSNIIPTLISALKIFLRSLPVGIHFNICSFGSSHSFLWESSHMYDEKSLKKATQHVETFGANLGGTETLSAIKAAIDSRDVQQDLALILCTDGDIWQQQELFTYLNKQLQGSKKHIRVFPLGIGNSVSSGLIEGVARAGKGFASTVGEHENMNSKIVRMLKAALVENVDYTLEVQYEPAPEDDDDFVLIDKVMDSLNDVALDDVKPGRGGSSEDDSTETKALTVAMPKLLQTPQEILPFYPGATTTIYLLMSSKAPDQKVKSIILRAASSKGPLQYHITVQTLEKPGETIHQLAARKAVGELEEGRGWLTFAKGRDGTLLSQQYANPPPSPEGDSKTTQFQMMVEREAVRLGVLFQVGGKWCSFVAVEGNEQTVQAGNNSRSKDNTTDDFVIAQASHILPLSTGKLKKSMAGFERQSLRSSRSASCSASSVGAPGIGGAVHAGAAARSHPVQLQKQQRRSASGLGVFSAFRAGARQARAYLRTAPQQASPENVESTPSNPLDQIITLQRFQGYWELNQALLDSCGIDKSSITRAMLNDNSSEIPSRKTVWGTLLAIVYLERKMADDKDAWELVVDKAKGFLQESGVMMQDEMAKAPLRNLLAQI